MNRVTLMKQDFALNSINGEGDSENEIDQWIIPADFQQFGRSRYIDLRIQCRVFKRGSNPCIRSQMNYCFGFMIFGS